MDERYKDVHAAVARLLTSLDIDYVHDENYKETPRRVAEYLLEKFPDKSAQEVARQVLAKKTFPSNYRGIVAQVGIHCYGLCPHHLLPVIYTVAVGYIPSGYTIGLSKLARLAEIELGVCGTQEDGTAALADAMLVALHASDVAVVVKGVHQCMLVRGVKQHSSFTETSEMRGFFRSNGDLRSEFYSLVRNGGSK